MNAGHKNSLRMNRFRRIARRLKELEAQKAVAVIMAEKAKQDPNIGGILAHISCLEERRGELAASN